MEMTRRLPARLLGAVPYMQGHDAWYEVTVQLRDDPCDPATALATAQQVHEMRQSIWCMITVHVRTGCRACVLRVEPMTDDAAKV
jgi:hypothetical protein